MTSHHGNVNPDTLALERVHHAQGLGDVMTLSQFNAWKADGKPFRLMTPADDLLKRLRQHGYTVYGIGNDSHMLANPAEDHTPFSQTGWPGTAKYGVGYAIDIMPPAKGAKSKLDGKPLPSLQQLGAQLKRDRNAGVSGISWLKYMNWEPERDNGGPCYQESWKPNHAQRTSSDRGHIHMSGRTGMESSTIARDYDPVARIRGVDDLTPDEHKWLETVHKNLTVLDGRNPIGQIYLRMAEGRDDTGAPVTGNHNLKAMTTQLTAIQAALSTLAGRDFTDEAAIVRDVLAGLTGEKLAAAIKSGLESTGLTPQGLAAAIPPQIARQVVDELTRRLDSDDAEDASQPPAA